ncbi:MAG: hypothetical protein R3282_06425 [Rhodothermales bacterium]|nr:hypothetical protein [Rhodothermales bacterium]
MMAGLRFAVVIALSAAVPAYSQGTELDRHETPLPQVTLPQPFDGVLRAYEAGWKGRDARVLADLFTDDGFVLRPGHPPARGKTAIVKAYENSGGPLVLRAYDFGLDGDVGYIIGGFARYPDDPDIGKFVLVLKRSASGRWLIAADMDNGNSR